MACFSIAWVALAVAVGDNLPAPAPTPAQHARARGLVDAMFDPATDADAANRTAAERAGDDLAAMGLVAVPYLIRVLIHERDEVRDRIACVIASKALEAVGRPAVGPVRAAWPTLTPAARWWLLDFRERFDYENVLPFLLGQLETEGGAKCAAAQRLAVHKEVRAVRPLLAALKAAEPAERYDIIQALGWIGGDDAIADVLVPLLHFNSWAARGEGLYPESLVRGAPIEQPRWPDGRRQVVAALANLKTAKAVPAMLALLIEHGEREEYVGQRVVPFLAEHGGLECVPELRRVAGSPRYSPEFRAKAAEAADKIAGRNG